MADVKSYARTPAPTGLGVAQFYLHSENVNEAALDLVELAYDNPPFGVGTLEVPPCALWEVQRAPIYQTVYHDYQRTCITTGIDAPLGAPILSDASQLSDIRRSFAGHIFFGTMPFAGALLS
jgi:hypothetical protein